MSGLTHKDLMALDMDTFHNEDEHGERVKYVPAKGRNLPSRSIVGIVDELGSMVEVHGGDDSQDFIDFEIRRSSTGGIDAPQIGDGIIRTLNGCQVGYSYTGTVREADSVCWVLRFVRQIRFKEGGLETP